MHAERRVGLTKADAIDDEARALRDEHALVAQRAHVLKHHVLGRIADPHEPGGWGRARQLWSREGGQGVYARNMRVASRKHACTLRSFCELANV